MFVDVGRYIRSNLNMPSSLPARSGGHRDYDKDCPITVFGSTQARLVGQYISFPVCSDVYIGVCVREAIIHLLMHVAINNHCQFLKDVPF